MTAKAMEDRVLEAWEDGERGKKRIARKLGIGVKRVRRILNKLGLSAPAAPEPSRLEPHKDRAAKLASDGLSNVRILEILQEEGYLGGKTMLGDYLRTVRPARQPALASRRFETPPAREGQVDWTSERIKIAGRPVLVHFLSLVLCWSRYLWIGAFRDEKLPSLLAAHVDALTAIGGVPERLVYDNMATVTLGRQGREPIWNPRFLDFARHWGLGPYACRPRHPNRKGKVERPFRYLRENFIPGRTFASWADLDQQLETWLERANHRVHGTTGAVPAERLEEERPLLIAPPDLAYPTYREVTGLVGRDGTVASGGVRYSVPAVRPGQTVAVRVHPRHIEVVDAAGKVLAQHVIPDRGRLVIDPAHYGQHGAPAPSRTELDERFCRRFPGCEAFLAGLKRRMKSLYAVHVRSLERLCLQYGTGAVEVAVADLDARGNFNACAVARLLARRFPEQATGAPSDVVGPAADLGDTDCGSLADYTLDPNPEDDQ